MAATDYKVFTQDGKIVIGKETATGRLSKDNRELSEEELMAIVYSYSRRHCIMENVTGFTLYVDNVPKVDIEVHFTEEEIKTIEDAVKEAEKKNEENDTK